jgi:hypothetical protein
MQRLFIQFKHRQSLTDCLWPLHATTDGDGEMEWWSERELGVLHRAGFGRHRIKMRLRPAGEVEARYGAIWRDLPRYGAMRWGDLGLRSWWPGSARRAFA